MEVRIEPIGKRHVAGFREVLDAVARERRWLAMTEAPTLPEVRRFVLANLRNDAPQFVALEGERVVGWCDIVPRPRATMRHAGVLGMGVAASHRGRGLGSRLLETTLEAAFDRGLTRVELVVLVDNLRAVELYRRHGFETEGRCRRYLVIDGAERDAWLMARLK
ncbi:MAG: GNAT family N-acetyltransferase [Steroidobacteraceae bacterium]